MSLLDNMRKHRVYATANTQGHIFEYASELGLDMETFTTEYMTSDFCNLEMDSDYSPFQNELDVPCMEVISNEFRTKGIKIPVDAQKSYRYCAYYIGFVYRYLQVLSGLSSKELVLRIPYEKMRLQYFFDHYEYVDAIKTICNYEGIQYE